MSVILLGGIAGPADLKRLPTTTLTSLAQEIREFLIAKVSGAGGHLGPNLGVVELTIAAHRVFDSPRDVLLFDTGQNCLGSGKLKQIQGEPKCSSASLWGSDAWVRNEPEDVAA